MDLRRCPSSLESNLVFEGINRFGIWKQNIQFGIIGVDGVTDRPTLKGASGDVDVSGSFDV